MRECPHGQNVRTIMERSYVEQRDGGYWMRDTRISLDSIVYAFKRGAAPESIQRAFPLLTLEEIYGAITFYLAHEQEIDAYLAQAEAEIAVQCPGTLLISSSITALGALQRCRGQKAVCIAYPSCVKHLALRMKSEYPNQ